MDNAGKRQRPPCPPNRRQPSPKPEVSNKTGTSPSGRGDRALFLQLQETELLERPTKAMTRTLLSTSFTQEVNAEQA